MLRVRLFLFIVLPGTALPVFAQDEHKTFAFTNVTVIDCTGAPAKSDMTVVVTGDRITALGKRDDVALPEKTRVIDCSGKFMIPGLWDMHVANVNVAALAVTRRSGTTSVEPVTDPGKQS